MLNNSTVFSRELLSRSADIAVLADSVQDWAATCGLSERTRHLLGILLDELVANIVRHAYTDREDGRIEVVMQLEDAMVCVTLRDFGSPFDPTLLAPADTTSGVDERDFGGLGIHFVRRIADRFSYRRDGDANEVTFCLSSIKESTP